MANTILADIDGWQKKLFGALVIATKAANAIPPRDVLFYKSLDKDFAANMTDASVASLALCNNLLVQASGPGGEKIKDGEEMIDRFDIITEVVDNLLEKVDVGIEEIKNPNKKKNSIAQSAPIVATAKTDRLDIRLMHAHNIARPQLRFPDAVDNSSLTPFIRKITYKPNAMVDLSYGTPQHPGADTTSALSAAMASHVRNTLGMGSELMSLPHPYEYEIGHISYPEHMFTASQEPKLYHPFATTTAKWVETEEALREMCEDLEMQTEIAIDLEHHNYRTFQGFVCLMQISTRDQDYIVDTLELRGSLHLLNESFTNPNIVKVLHGAESDIIWLQRDFGVYIVNLFDTYHASKVLEFGSHSLAHLLKYYCDFDADKRYQLADWRIRPLPKEMLEYARSDTHFLLYIYDRMRQTLIDQGNPTTHNLLKAVLKRSEETSVRKHEKEIYDAEGGEGPNGWRPLYSRWNRALDNQQFAVFLALHAWRDQTAREEDESVRYVLPNHMLFTLAEKMPEEQMGVVACCNPVPPLVKMNAADLAYLIGRAKLSVTPPAAGGGFKPVEMPEPVHIRFDPATGLQGVKDETKDSGKSTSSAAGQETETASATATTTKAKKTAAVVQAATSSTLFSGSSGRLPEQRRKEEAGQWMAASSVMFGTLDFSKGASTFLTLSSSKDLDENEDEEHQRAKQLVRQILEEIEAGQHEEFDFRTLTIEDLKAAAAAEDEAEERSRQQQQQEDQTPGSTATSTSTEPQEVLYTPVEERTTKKRTDVLVLSSMSKKRSRAIDEDSPRAEVPVVEVLSSRDVSEEDENEEGAGEGGNGGGSSSSAAVNVKRKKNRDRAEKKNRSGSKQASDQQQQQQQQQAQADFTPFDYNSVRSVVDETMEPSKKKKKKNKGNKGGGEPEQQAFNPYATLEVDAKHKKKDASFSRSAKSGNKSMSFKV
ncbi:exosome nuclease subunit [Actinomortierella ambigua]|uniref:Exosome nuclease subunit n=1 Tax=Actinomortierella ambigua TaxID=1343610 RepID=A0A9P6QGN8_9FUNG|nr:exosome nuclease subunit [Actinomortierella ambigua]